MNGKEYQGACSYTASLYQEATKGFQDTLSRTLILRCVSITLAVLLLVFMHLSGIWDDLCHYFVILGAVYLISLGIDAFRRRKNSYRYRQLLSANNGAVPKLRCRFTEKEILACRDGEENSRSYDYDKVRYIFETEKLLVPVMEYALCLPVEKDSLKYEEYDVRQLLLERCTGMKSKRIRSTFPGRLLFWLQTVIIVVAMLLALCQLPFIQRLADTARGQTDVYAVAQTLQELGITVADESLLPMIEEDLSDRSGLYYRRNQTAVELLFWLGAGDFDPETWQWTPSESGVYWFDMEVLDVSTMYTDFLRGVSAASKGELVFTDIQEDLSGVNIENGSGLQRVSFRWKDQPYQLTAKANYDWFDPDAAYQLNAILKSQGSEKQLFFASDDGQGCFVFYADSQWAKEFERRIGIQLLERMY